MQWTLPYNKVDKLGNPITTYELQIVSCEKVSWIYKNQIFSQRCILPIDGYFEYHHMGKNKYPHYIYPKSDEDIFYVGGVWNHGIDKKTGQEINKFSLITTPPNPLVGKIHNNPDAENGPRMLLLIPRERTREYLDETLDANQLKSFFKPYPEDTMKAHTVLRFQTKENAPYLNTARNIEYCNYPELSGSLLFN
jgi:putative SOS response-associated peptidase YedK